MAARGESVTWEEVEIDPRYRFKNETILELLEITPEEQRQMKTLVSPAEKSRRREEKRRKAGVISREEYEGKAARRRSEARRMASEDLPFEEIAKALDVSVHSVHSYVFR
jgi:DNA-directed RNA polymerase specialized sigma24 family protein